MDILNGCNTWYVITIFSIITLLYNIYYFYKFERRVQSVGQWPHCADQSPGSRERSFSLQNK